jgi:hypothetical protein
MKKIFLPAVAMALIAAGCAQAHPQPVLGIVGPAPRIQSNTDVAPAGSLMVYSAFETRSLGASPFDDVRPHTSYELYSEKGVLLQKIGNSDTGLGETPSSVKLAPGVYQVVAKTNGHGYVRVSVRIENNRLTTVHLDSEGPAIADQSKAVRLPDGEVIGWSSAR